MKTFETPVVEVVEFQVNDVITASFDDSDTGEWT
jgi:hypothetical protein